MNVRAYVYEWLAGGGQEIGFFGVLTKTCILYVTKCMDLYCVYLEVEGDNTNEF